MNNNTEQTDADDSVDEQAADWFVLLRSERVTRGDEAEFLRWLEQAEAHKTAFYEICEMWGDDALLESLTTSAARHAIAPVKKKRCINTRPVVPALAAGVLVAALLWEPARIYFGADYSVAVGQTQTVQLQDGSKAILNSGSALAVTMDQSQRSVRLLKGEAYFEVKPDPDLPFVVLGRRSATRVLGTRFIVDRHGDSDEIKVLAGRVEVAENRRWKQPVVLSSGQAVTVSANAIGEPQSLSSTLSTSWINGFLVYQNETLENVVGAIGRYSRAVVVFKDDSLRTLKINGRLNIRDSRAMLGTLQSTLGLKMRFWGDWLVVIG